MSAVKREFSIGKLTFTPLSS